MTNRMKISKKNQQKKILGKEIFARKGVLFSYSGWRRIVQKISPKIVPLVRKKKEKEKVIKFFQDLIFVGLCRRQFVKGTHEVKKALQKLEEAVSKDDALAKISTQ